MAWAAAYGRHGRRNAICSSIGSPVSSAQRRPDAAFAYPIGQHLGPGCRGWCELARGGREARIVGDIASVNEDSQVQKALRRLTAEMAPTAVTQLVMWRLASKLDWDTIGELSRNWANDYEMTLAKDFVEHLDALPEGEAGRLLFQVDGKDEAGAPIAKEVSNVLRGKMVLGLLAQVVEVPSRPDGPASCMSDSFERQGGDGAGFQQ